MLVEIFFFQISLSTFVSIYPFESPNYGLMLLYSCDCIWSYLHELLKCLFKLRSPFMHKGLWLRWPIWRFGMSHARVRLSSLIVIPIITLATLISHVIDFFLENDTLFFGMISTIIFTKRYWYVLAHQIHE